MKKNKTYTKLINKRFFPDKLKISFGEQIYKDSANKTSKGYYKNYSGYQGNIKEGSLSVFTVWKLVPFYLFLIIIFSLILFRSWQLQVIEGKKYRVLAEENRIRFQITDAPRGIIYDQNGYVLARNIPGVKVYFSPYELSQETKEQVISNLSMILNKNIQEIRDLITEGEKNSIAKIAIKSNIDHEKEIEILARKDDLPGVSLEEGIIREYLEGEIFSNIIGYNGELSQEELESENYSKYFLGEKIGRSGLEKYYESDLKGTLGQKLIEVDANGQEKELIYETKSASGNGLILNIDHNLQRKVYEVLQVGIINYKSTGAIGIFQDVTTGRVLSMVSLPSYDNNVFAKGVNTSELEKIQSDPGNLLFNRAISGTYPSGSTIKPLVGVAALEEGIIKKDTLFNDTGVITMGVYRFPDWKIAWGLAPNGNINVIDAIAQSCDTFFYAIGGGYGSQSGLGIDNLGKYAVKFGLSKLTNIDLPGENEGLYPTPEWKEDTQGEAWYLGDTYWVAIGQSYVLTTPIQINNYTTAVANGGTLYKPQIVNRVVDTNKRTIFQKEPEILNSNFIYKENLDIVKEGMRKGVDGGIIYPLRDAKYKVAAKTGTAEFGKKDAHGYYESHAWVTGFFPYDNPKVSFTILFEAGGESSNAAKAAKEIIDWYYDYEQSL
ncbi:penicillin-binding protein 2 [candidate division CPR3 bacterium GWF2_35_18]|uniref:Penicillin-binding protein 2 n=1 Tax=candidate division CPR3 bacterium GW2011_GWF2_35_18 TaxID=1618350 RepID=A0A0G0E2N6_UNCC3|nr:MAG: Penicillin-binding protein 2 [candidate division CPR3 bacterium GW2011_GWF2_35_18]OGB62953.1 MAG: penicillin-binding protein 2 [candidate division CPR3 bacterium GWF2_35_18]OGB65921.1 MAG: penicillin-binding protein 2 [candidate division CPR3 bacterium RIFOXYA2_FULL_35_13]OGB79259.1 MAG: penicillin-binding protein 2 [candidate division CPR3 bacterium RIFOXYB2_FULL_35_8]